MPQGLCSLTKAMHCHEQQPKLWQQDTGIPENASLYLLHSSRVQPIIAYILQCLSLPTSPRSQQHSLGGSVTTPAILKVAQCGLRVHCETQAPFLTDVQAVSCMFTSHDPVKALRSLVLQTPRSRTLLKDREAPLSRVAKG